MPDGSGENEQGRFDMPIRKSDAAWTGGLKDGGGQVLLGSGAFEGAFSAGSRFEDAAGTNPEELIAAAHAGCFSMALGGLLEESGHQATRIQTRAEVKLEKQDAGFAITGITLRTRGQVPGIDEATFREQATKAKDNCPVSKALLGTAIEVEASLES
jgi:osmotically inducible protein OsmC